MTQHRVGVPWAWIQPRVRDPDVSIRDKITFPKGILPHPGGGSTPSGSASPWHNWHPESGITRWHLCDPEGPWQGGKPAEDRQFLREGWFGVFHPHFLAQEGRAHCWQSLFPRLPTSKLSQSLCLLNFRKEGEKIRISKLRSSWSCTWP